MHGFINFAASNSIPSLQLFAYRTQTTLFQSTHKSPHSPRNPIQAAPSPKSRCSSLSRQSKVRIPPCVGPPESDQEYPIVETRVVTNCFAGGGIGETIASRGSCPAAR